ncbi:MAG TPA: SagB/ThcOx family dehydrogenase [Allosphingosinicella sp.]|jgi:SagB-type dehydrogenase family enzyme
MQFLFNTDDIVPPEARRLGELFHENSKLHPRASAELGRWIGELMENPAALSTMSQSFKRYDNAPSVPLPAADPPDRPLPEILARRRSVLSGSSEPKFSGRPLGGRDLSILLGQACGITEVREMEAHGVKFLQRLRAYPSGGGLQPIEIYPILQNVDDAYAGVHHYDVVNHRLEKLGDRLAPAQLDALCSFGDLLREAAAIIVLTAVFSRSYFKYHDRGYRFVLLEAGHVAQNLYLQATALDLAVVAVGGFFDDAVNRLLGIDGLNEAAVYLVVVGHPPAPAAS